MQANTISVCYQLNLFVNSVQPATITEVWELPKTSYSSEHQQTQVQHLVDIRKNSTWSWRCMQSNFFAPWTTDGPFTSSNSKGIAAVIIKIRYYFALAANFDILPRHTLLFSAELMILKNIGIS